MILLRLPFPPTVNTYWRHLPNGRTLISERGRAYKASVWLQVKTEHPGLAALSGLLSVRMVAYPPTRALRDLDNLLKAPLDALTGAGLWLDDSQIRRLSIEWGEVRRGGGLDVEVQELAGASAAE